MASDDFYTIKEILQKLESKIDKVQDDISEIKAQSAVMGKQTEVNTQDISRLKDESRTWSTLNSVGVAIAALLGIIIKGGA